MLVRVYAKGEIYSMKNIKDIMSEIEKLNPEIATTDNETPNDETKTKEIKTEPKKIETSETVETLFNNIPELKNIPKEVTRKFMNKFKGIPKEAVDELMEIYKNIPESVKQNLVAKAKSMESKDVKKQLSDLAAQQRGESWNGYGCPGHFDGTVNVCCTTKVPKVFDIDTTKLDEDNVKFIFDTSCLHCCIEPCDFYICGTKIKLFKIKIVGHLPYAFSAPDALQGHCGNYSGADGRCWEDYTADLCCHDSVCVDNTVCCTHNIDDAKWICKFFEFLLRYCLICVEVDDAEICCKHQYVTPGAPPVDPTVDDYGGLKKCCHHDRFVNFKATLWFLTW